MGIMQVLFGDLNKKEVKKLEKIADKVIALEDETAKLTDEELRAKTKNSRSAARSRESRWIPCFRKPLQCAVRQRTAQWA